MANNETSIIISAVDKTQGALNSVNSNLSSLEGQFSKLTGVVSGFAALAGVTAFAGIVKGAVDSAAGLHDMAQQTGASVESLSAMRSAAKLAGVDMEQVAGGLGKLSKNMLAASQGSGDAAKVFSALGISVTDTNGKMKSSDAVFMEFSKSLQTIGSSSERAAAAQLVLGKSGAQLMPMMNDMAVAGTLQAKITTAQAAAADELQDNILRLSTVGQAWKTTVAMEMVPAANAFVEALLEVSTTTDGSKKAAKELAADGSIKEWAINSTKAVGFVVDAFDGAARVVKAIGMTIGAAAAQAAMVAQGNFSGALAIGKEWQNDMGSLAGKEQFSDILARKLAAIGAEAPKAAEGTTSLAEALKKLFENGNKASNALENLHITQMALVTKQATAELDALTKQQDEYAKALQSALGPLETQAQNLEREVANYGLAESAIQGTIVARLEEARALAELNGAWPEHLNYLDQEIAARKRIASASSQKDFLDANKKAAEQSAKEWEKFSDDIERSLTDSLYRSFEAADGYAETLVKSIQNTFKAAGLKLVVQYVVSGTGSIVASAANAVLGTSFGSGGSGSTGSNILGDTSSAMSLYNAGSSLYGYSQAAYAGYGMTAEQAAAASNAYWNAGYYGNSLATSSGNYLATGSNSLSAGGSAAATYGTSAGSQQTALLAAQDSAFTSAGLAESFSSYLAGGSWVFAVPAIGAALNQTKTRYEDTSISGSYIDGKFVGELIDKFKTASNGFNAAETSRVITPISGDLSAMTDYYTPGMVQQSLDFTERNRQVMDTREGGSVSDDIYAGQLEAAQISGINSGAQAAADAVARTGAIKTAFDNIYTSIKSGLVHAGEALWDSSFSQKLEGFAQEVNVKGVGSMQAVVDMTAGQISSGMSAIVLPAINELKTSTETWGEALTRLMAEANNVAGAFDLLGYSLKDVFGPNNADAILGFSDAMIKAFGTSEALGSSVSSYFSNFYSEAEIAAKKWEGINDQFAALNFAVPKTREEFKALVDGLDKTAPSYAATFKAVMDLSVGFAALVPAINDVVAATTEIIDTAGRKSWGDKLAVLTGQKTQTQVDRDNTLASTADTAVQAIMRLVFAQEDLATAAELTAAAVAAAAEETKQIAEAMRVATIASFDRTRASNDAYKSSIQAFSTSGLAAITEAVSLEKQRIGVIRSVAAESVASIKGVFSLLENQVNDLYGTVASTQAMQASEGSAFIASALQNALSSGYLPDQSALSSAISGARSGLDANNFATQFEADRAALVMAGQLSQLRAVAGQQLPAAEQAVKLADEQLKALDTSLSYYKKQLDSLNGIKEGTSDLTGTVEEIGQSVIAKITAMNANFSSLSDALLNNIVTASKSGSISASDTTAELGKSGVAADKAALVGGSAVFTSSNGATLIDGVFRATNGYTGSITDAKAIITDAFNGLSAKEFQARAIGIGLSAAMIDYMYSFSPGWTNSWAAQNGLPAFASGTNYVQRDMIAQIHEGEAIIPKAYNPAIGNNGNTRLENLVEGLTAEVQRLQAIVDTGNKHASRTANAVNGNPEQPMLVETV